MLKLLYLFRPTLDWQKPESWSCQGLCVCCWWEGSLCGIVQSKQAVMHAVVWEKVTGREGRQSVGDAHWDLLCSREKQCIRCTYSAMDGCYKLF